MKEIYNQRKWYKYMTEDILRILKMISQKNVKSLGQSVDFDQLLTFYKIR